MSSESKPQKVIVVNPPKITVNKQNAANFAVLSKANTKNSTSSSSTAKKRTPPAKKQKILLTDNDPVPANPLFNHPEIIRDEITWLDPGPGYATPLFLTDMPVWSGLLVTQWAHWEKEDQIGYLLYDEKGVKWRADASCIHLLGRAAAFGITQAFFNFVVYRQEKKFNYGFTPKSAAKEEQLKLLAAFGEEETQLPDFLTHEPPLAIPPQQPKKEQSEHTPEVEATFVSAAALHKQKQTRKRKQSPAITVKTPPLPQQQPALGCEPPPPPQLQQQPHPHVAAAAAAATIDLCHDDDEDSDNYESDFIEDVTDDIESSSSNSNY